MGTYIRCYKVITQPENWNNAALECGSLDPPARLAIPDTAEVRRTYWQKNKCLNFLLFGR